MKYWKQLLEIEKRNKKIITYRDKGWTLKKIALKYGISKQRVFAILKEKSDYIPNHRIKSDKYLSEKEKIDILNRFNNECQICYSTTKVQIHHLDRNRENNKKNNLMVLCYNCHRKLHAGIL